MSNGQISVNENGIPKNSLYFSLSYDEETNSYFYDSFHFIGGLFLTNMSDLNTFSLIYQEISLIPASIQYINYSEVENRYDENGELREFNEYEEKDAFLHKYLTHCMYYSGEENTNNPYYKNHYNSLISSVIEKFSSYTPTAHDPFFLYEESDKRPTVNPSLYYLTAGYTKPIINFYEYGERPTVYASIEGFPFGDRDVNHILLVATEDICLELPITFFIEDLTYETNCGIFDVVVKLKDEEVPLKIYSNSDLRFNEGALLFFPELMDRYFENELFVELLEFFTNDITYLKENIQTIRDFFNTNITVDLFRNASEFENFATLFDRLMLEIEYWYF
jgi:hypothetical protein